MDLDDPRTLAVIRRRRWTVGVLLACGLVMAGEILVTVEWSFPYCNDPQDGPASAVFGAPIPYERWSTVSSLEYDFAPHLYLLNIASCLELRCLSCAAAWRLWRADHHVQRTALKGLAGDPMASSCMHPLVPQTEEGAIIPGLDTAEQLAQALGVSPCWLAFAQGRGIEGEQSGGTGCRGRPSWPVAMGIRLVRGSGARVVSHAPTRAGT